MPDSVIISDSPMRCEMIVMLRTCMMHMRQSSHLQEFRVTIPSMRLGRSLRSWILPTDTSRRDSRSSRSRVPMGNRLPHGSCIIYSIKNILSRILPYRKVLKVEILKPVQDDRAKVSTFLEISIFHFPRRFSISSEYEKKKESSLSKYRALWPMP